MDCTLRDGAYIVGSRFGAPAIKGIINRMQDANIDIIECGWLKNDEHTAGTSFYHIPADMERYIISKSSRSVFVAMIDWDRYDTDALTPYDGKSIDAVRVVFPSDKYREGIAVGAKIAEKGYKVYYQAANTLGYTDEELIELAECVNKAHPVCLSVVDTFGAMFAEDLIHIVSVLDSRLDKDIQLGFHSHNNQQLSFALSIQFIQSLCNSERNIVVDSSLCGMGRGAGNTTTELMANYINLKYSGNYDMNVIMDTIDTYMGYFIENYSWGYSTPYFISGMYCAHVNNIAYLQNSHRTNARDMRNIISSMSESDRKKYDYDLLEKKYIEYQAKAVDDKAVLQSLRNKLSNKKILLILPGKTIVTEKAKVDAYIKENDPIVIGVNAVNENYSYDYLFFSNSIRYDYAKEIYNDIFLSAPRIITSNIKTQADDGENIISFDLIVKRGWEHFDNSGIVCLRLMDKLHAENVAMAGFDGFNDEHSESYADISIPHISPGKKWNELNDEIQDMFNDLINSTSADMRVSLITSSMFRHTAENDGRLL